jgi:hypothetical protein
MRLWLGLAALCFSVVVMFLGRKFGIVLRDKTITTRDLDALEAVLGSATAILQKYFNDTTLLIVKYEMLSLKRQGGNVLIRLRSNNVLVPPIIMKRYMIDENDGDMRSDIVALEFAKEVSTLKFLALFNGKVSC